MPKSRDPESWVTLKIRVPPYLKEKVIDNCVRRRKTIRAFLFEAIKEKVAREETVVYKDRVRVFDIGEE